MNERVTLPNALVLASHVTNFTQLARSHGLILHTEVSIGYDVPWREVKAMLLDAAKRTPGITGTPAPFVRQQKLGEFAPVYGVFVTTNDEGAMGGIYTALHANIQDVFAEKGIQIMTPNYEADPEVPKIPAAAGRAGCGAGEIRSGMRYKRRLAVAAALALCAGAASAADGFGFDVEVSLTPKAAETLGRTGEGIVVSAWWYADPKAGAEQHTNPVGLIDVGTEEHQLEGDGGHGAGRRRRRWIPGRSPISAGR